MRLVIVPLIGRHSGQKVSHPVTDGSCDRGCAFMRVSGRKHLFSGVGAPSDDPSTSDDRQTTIRLLTNEIRSDSDFSDEGKRFTLNRSGGENDHASEILCSELVATSLRSGSRILV